VCNLDQADAVAEYFSRQKVDGIIICALNFGYERSAAKIAEKLRVPVLLYATKEPPVRKGPAWRAYLTRTAVRCPSPRRSTGGKSHFIMPASSSTTNRNFYRKCRPSFGLSQ